MKYIWAYSIPLVAFLGIYIGGFAMFAALIYAFVFIPCLELALPVDASNYSESEKKYLAINKLFDFLLYMNVPIVFGLLFYSLQKLTTSNLSLFEIIGMTLSTGIVLGANGINVAHELGHRTRFFERMLGKLLLIPSHYTHFFIEHNHGHHLYVGTAEDPSTAKFDQSIYSFWVQTVVGTYTKAWKIQLNLNKVENRSLFSFKSDMFWFTLFQGFYLTLVYTIFDFKGLLFAIFGGVVGLLLLETINYIEHYGLKRKLLDTGRYERVSEKHSWNSNHVIGRIMLYELTRHSDHHYKSQKKYQILEYHTNSPQLPYGYPTCMVLSFIPPLWFAIMNKRIPKEML